MTKLLHGKQMLAALLIFAFPIVVADRPHSAQAAENLIANPSLEAGSTLPTGWAKSSWGSNNASFSYPVAGFNDAKAAKVEITNYSSGDAKWYFDAVNVSAGQTYLFEDSYNSNVSSEVGLWYTLANGTNQYAFVSVLPSSSGIWKKFSHTFSVPANAKSVTVFHLLESVGSLTVDNYSLKQSGGGNPNQNPEYLSGDQVLQLEADGHEIGAHTRSHPDLTTLNSSQLQDEIAGSRQDLLDLGIKQVDTFVYPFGNYNNVAVNAVKNAGFIGARTTDEGFEKPAGDKYRLLTQSVVMDLPLEQVKKWIDEAKATNTWLILIFHQINYDPEAIYGNTPEVMQGIIDYIKQSGIKMITMREGLQKMK